MKKLTEYWQKILTAQPETGMGYQTATIVLKDKRVFDDVVILQSTLITEVRGFSDVMFPRICGDVRKNVLFIV